MLKVIITSGVVRKGKQVANYEEQTMDNIITKNMVNF